MFEADDCHLAGDLTMQRKSGEKPSPQQPAGTEKQYLIVLPNALASALIAYQRQKWKRGNCYQDACHYVLFENREAILCHGLCMGQGGDVAGLWHGHAWAEVTYKNLTLCLDVYGVREQKAYYKAGQCRSVHKYTTAEATELMLEHNHYGPWTEEHIQINEASCPSRHKKKWKKTTSHQK